MLRSMQSSLLDLSQPRLLLLWDVDHTLIETRGMGFVLYQRAFKAATGKDLHQLATVSGRTEFDIAAETLRINGLQPTCEAIAALANALIDAYAAATGELAVTGRALPGAKETLALFAHDSAIRQTILTGNFKEVARIKLETFNLARYLDLEAGAYGNDDRDRAKLVRLAQRRTQTITGVAFANNQTVIIGDTPNDVRAAKVSGVYVIAVATGKSSEYELKKAGADETLTDLRDAERTGRLIYSLCREFDK